MFTIKGEIIKIANLEEYIREHDSKLDSSIGQRIDGDIDEFLKSSLTNYLDSFVNKNFIKIPANFQDFYDKQRAKWILNAIEALNYQENVHY